MRKKTKKIIETSITLAFIIITAISVYYILTPQENKTSKKAIILDSLSDEVPDNGAIKEIAKILQENGYNVTIITGKNVTVDTFRNLTSYTLIIIRSHGGYLKPGDVVGNVKFTDINPVIFTAQKYKPCIITNCEYLQERLKGEVTGGTTTTFKKIIYTLTPLFIEHLPGKFKDETTIILASCYGLKSDKLAKAFIKKGAKYFISFEEKVTPQYLDQILKIIIKNKFVNGMTWKKAIQITNDTFGPDPVTRQKIKIYKKTSSS